MKVGPRNAMVIAVCSLALAVDASATSSRGVRLGRPGAGARPRAARRGGRLPGGGRRGGEPDRRRARQRRLPAARAARAHAPRARAVRRMRIELTVNGERREADVWAGESLLFVLRERLGLPGLEERVRAGRVRLVLGAARRLARLRVPGARRAGGRARRSSPSRGSPRTACCTGCRRRSRTPAPSSAGSARRGSSSPPPTCSRASRIPTTTRSARRCPGISAAAPATPRSSTPCGAAAG